MRTTPHVLDHCGQCGLTIVCGMCGTSQCNGGRGCADCDSAHDLFQQCFSESVIYSEVRATSDDIRTWLLAQLKDIPEMAGSSDPRWAVEQATEVATTAFDWLVALEKALKAAEGAR